MKKNIKILSLVALIAVFSACREDNVLDLSPVNQIASEDAFSTPTLIENSMNGVYNAAAIGQYNSSSPNGGRGYLWGAAFAQQGDTHGEDVVSTATFYQNTYTNIYDTGTANNVYYWVDGYRLISRCNTMIKGVTDAVAKGTISQAVANDYIGQSKFLRAITHFEMLMYFSKPYQDNPTAANGGIPYREVAITTAADVESELAKPRNTVAECYAKVINDLNDAEALITNTQKFKATKEAAIAFKTRVYLHKRDWANVIAEGVKLNTKFSLTTAPDGVFTSNFANTETIFSIQHSAINNPGVNAALASQYSNRLLICISPIIWRDPQWLVDDKRRIDNSSSTSPGTGMVFTSSGRKYTNKYKDRTGMSDAAPVIRYAEVVLNMAEAYARLNDLTNGLSFLNKVRDRALANPSTQSYTATTLPTKNDIVKAVIKERRIEFLCEGRRWSDIHRLQGDDIAPINGIPAKLANGNPAASAFALGTPYTGALGVTSIPYSDYRFLWPIPQLETSQNPTLAAQQNPGW